MLVESIAPQPIEVRAFLRLRCLNTKEYFLFAIELCELAAFSGDKCLVFNSRNALGLALWKEPPF